jgi:CDP-diacylglycerol--serine O-phosphatidyltransferase
MRGGHWPANLATLANAAVGVGAVVYVLAGNPLWAMLLVVSGLGFDGLDGLFHRRSGLPEGRFGRFADSIADAITFGLAPAVLIIVHTENAQLWRPWAPGLLVAGVLLAALAWTRLVWFSFRAYHNPHFVGVPTPQTALGIVIVLLLFDSPAFLGTQPAVVLGAAVVLAIAMVIPVRFPKIRRGARLRSAMAVTGVALVLALLPLQFRPSSGSAGYLLAFGATLVALVGVATYYVLGPSTVPGPGYPPEVVRP